MSPKIFSMFKPVMSVADGQSVFDFLGGSINVEYKKNWKPNKAGHKYTPALPAPNEWYVDWLASLSAAYFADNQFQVVELGAGYAQWTVTSIHAYKNLKPDGVVYALALEADITHSKWMLDHVKSNLCKYSNINTSLLNKAAGSDGVVSFPIISEPSSVYGASYVSGVHADNSTDDYVHVESLSLKSVYSLTKKKTVDLLHIDIQGAEVDLLLKTDPADQLANTKVVLIGTHKSDDVHNYVREKLVECGLKVLIDWPRNSKVNFFGHEIDTNDGALLAVNPLYINIEIFSEMIGSA